MAWQLPQQPLRLLSLCQLPSGEDSQQSKRLDLFPLLSLFLLTERRNAH